MVKLLRPVGFDLHEASNGIEALAIFKQWSPHAVLMDLRMPVMDGYEATRRIKATKTGRATPVIGVTANVFEQSKNRIMDTGVDTYICKPFRQEELFEVLKKVLGLRYLFANESAGPIVHQPLTAEALAALPNALIQAMRQAVAAGDMGRLTTLIGDVAKVDLAVASGLQALASRYDYDQLNEWLQQGKGEHD
jgi:CheY-like chemotaxis protein